MSNELVTTNAEAYRASTDAAALCKQIVVASAQNIQGKKYIKVEGWQAIAVAHGCAAGARDVERVEGGVTAIGEIRRMSDGVVIATAEGFVGEDEPTWFGGGPKNLAKRADYAIRAMAQTRAISRACRSAFAHVVVMMNAGLSTTPAEEVPYGGFDNGQVIDQEPDRRVVNPATGRKVDPMSANQAKKDGRAEQAVKLAHEMTDIMEVTELLAWRTSKTAEVETWPPAWQTALWDQYDLHLAELRAIIARELGADAETGEVVPA